MERTLKKELALSPFVEKRSDPASTTFLLLLVCRPFFAAGFGPFEVDLDLTFDLDLDFVASDLIADLDATLLDLLGVSMIASFSSVNRP